MPKFYSSNIKHNYINCNTTYVTVPGTKIWISIANDNKLDKGYALELDIDKAELFIKDMQAKIKQAKEDRLLQLLTGD